MWMREQKRKENGHIYYPTSQGNLFFCKAFRRYMRKKNEAIYRIDFHKTIGIHTAAEGVNNLDTQELQI